MRRAQKMGLEKRIKPHLATENSLDLDVNPQFILAFYMVHEVPDVDLFMAQVADSLRMNGRFMMVEPPFHVSARGFQESIHRAEASGLVLEDRYKILFGRTAVFTKSATRK